MKPKLRLTQVHEVQDLGPYMRHIVLRDDYVKTQPGYQKDKTYTSAYWQA